MTGAIASPKPKPPSTSGERGEHVVEGVLSHCAIQTNAAAASTIPHAASTPTVYRLEQPAADQRADRKGGEQADQHERRPELGVGVDRDPGEDRDVDQCRDQCRPDEERHDDRAPCGRAAARRAG